MMFKDSTGRKSLTVTLSIISFAVVMLKTLFSGASISIEGLFSYSFGTIGADEIAALLTPVLGTYAFRRYTDRKFDTQVDPSLMEGGEK